MANLWSSVRGREQRYSVDDYLNDLAQFTFNGHAYVAGGGSSTDREGVENNFASYVQGAYKRNGVVFATILARSLLFSEARFQYQQMQGGRPGKLFGTSDLEVLETPWPNGTTGELLTRMEQDVSTAGNAYIVREGKRLRRLRPDWVEIILSAPPDKAVQSDVVGYLYTPGGTHSGAESHVYLPGEIAHWSPIPDPEAQYRGMSWLTPVILEVQADIATTRHKKKYFDNGASPKLSVSFKESVTKAQFDAFMTAFKAAHQGVDNAYGTMFLGGGADVKTVGADLRQLDFKATQGAGETRITAAGGVPAVIVGLSEGLQAATYSNYGQARRKFGDHWARPQWRSAAAALSVLVKVPPGARLWYDDRDIAFLREDQKDAAEIQQTKAQTIRQLVDAGFEPASVVASVEADDRSLLVHTGLFSVQLQKPGSGQPDIPPKGAPGEDQ